MTNRRKPNSDLHAVLDELLRTKTVAQNTHRDRMRLYGSFVAHARFDPELLRQELELPPEYDQNDPREARKPSYRNLPVFYNGHHHWAPSVVCSAILRQYCLSRMHDFRCPRPQEVRMAPQRGH